jgi:hypothetical protein
MRFEPKAQGDRIEKERNVNERNIKAQGQPRHFQKENPFSGTRGGVHREK